MSCSTGWVPQLINKIQRLNLLFLSVTRFSHLCKMIRIMTQEVLRNWGNMFLNGHFLTVLPRVVFRTQPKIYEGAFWNNS